MDRGYSVVRFLLLLFVAFATSATAQSPIDITVPAHGSWLLTGGGAGQDDAPAPFLPAMASIETAQSGADIRIMDQDNTTVLRTMPLLADGPFKVLIRRGERLLIDAGNEVLDVAVSYGPAPVPVVLDNSGPRAATVGLSDGRQFSVPAKSQVALLALPGTRVSLDTFFLSTVTRAPDGQAQVIALR